MPLEMCFLKIQFVGISLPNVVAYSDERWKFPPESVCLCVGLFVVLFVGLFVCQHDKHRMMKHGGRCTVQKSRLSSIWGSALGPVHPLPPNVAFGYDVGKISAGCLVSLHACCLLRFSLSALVHTEVATGVADTVGHDT